MQVEDVEFSIWYGKVAALENHSDMSSVWIPDIREMKQKKPYNSIAGKCHIFQLS